MADGKVVGIGAVFLRADDPERQAAWYRDTLGIAATEPGKATPDGSYSWDAAGGEMVFTFVPRASSDFALINLKVTGIDALIERLRGGGSRSRPTPNGTTRASAASRGLAIRRATRLSCGSRPRRSDGLMCASDLVAGIENRLHSGLK